jgi:hypothetical protein
LERGLKENLQIAICGYLFICTSAQDYIKQQTNGYTCIDETILSISDSIKVVNLAAAIKNKYFFMISHIQSLQ